MGRISPFARQSTGRPLPLSVATLGACALLLSGCMSAGNNQLAPLTPVPTRSVASAPLAQPLAMPPVQPVATQTLADAAGQPLDGSAAGTQTALATPAAAAATAVTEDDLIGAWSASTPAATCSINLSLTNWTGGYRASTRNCGDTQLASLSAWSVEGQQVVLKGTDGAPLARLYRTGGTRYAGQLESGQAVTVFR